MRQYGVHQIEILGRIWLNGYVRLKQQAASVTDLVPPADFVHFYTRDNGSGLSKLFFRDEAGTEFELVAGPAGSAPGHTIRENGTNQTARLGLNFIDANAGTGLITDDSVGNETEVNLNLYLLASGVRALTADWDAGSFEIRAQTFESDVVTGTAPLVIASTTKVANLNADLLDDQSGAFYLDSANFTGTDWTDLTDAGATTLHKHDHGGMDGLADDDHAQYVLADGTRAMTGNLELTVASSSYGLFVTPTDTLVDGSKLSSPALRMRAIYDSDPTGGITATTVDADIVHVVAGSGPNSYVAVRFGGLDVLRLFDGSGGLKSTVLAAGTAVWSIAIGSTGEEASLWSMAVRDVESAGSKDWVFEDGSSQEFLHIRSTTLLTDVLRGMRIRNNQATGADTLAVEMVANQTGYLFVARNTSAQPYIRIPANDSQRVEIYTQDASKIGLFIRGAASQSADLQQWQDSGGNSLVKITGAGVLDMGGSDIINIEDLSMDSDGVARMEGQNRFRFLNSAARATKSVQVLTTGVTAVLTWDTESFDTDTIHDTVTNNSRLTTKLAGKYIISGSLQYEANATGRRLLILRKNGTTNISVMSLNATTAGEPALLTNTIEIMAVNDYVELLAFQNSGGNLNALSSGAFLAMAYVGD